MQTESADAQKPNLPLMTFNDHQLTVIEFEERPWFIAKQVGAKLGYAEDGGNLVKMIGRDWSEEFIEGADYQKLTNGRLAAFKAAIKNSVSQTHQVDPRSPSLLLLSESGAQLAAMKREGPEGVTFRKLLRFTILPEWQKARQGAPSVPAPTASPALTAKPDAEQRRQVQLQEIQSALKGWPLDALRMVDGYLRVWDGNAEVGTDYNAAMGHLMRLLLSSTPEEVAELTRLLEAARTKPPGDPGLLSAGTRLGLALTLALRGLSYNDAKLLNMVGEAEKQWAVMAPLLPGGSKPVGAR